MKQDSIFCKLITKRFKNMVAKFNDDLKSFAAETGEKEPTLYENICTSFTLSDVRIDGDTFVYVYDGTEERDPLFRFCDDVTDEQKAIEEGDYFSFVDQVSEDIKFWRACLRRAKKYWAMSCEELDAKEESYLNGDSDDDDNED